MADAELTTALKQAHMKKMFFAIVLKGPEAKLLVSERKIQPAAIEEAKKALGGGTPVQGTCSGPLTGLVFQVAKEPPAMLGLTIQKVIKSETGLNVVARVQLAALDPEEEPR